MIFDVGSQGINIVGQEGFRSSEILVNESMSACNFCRGSVVSFNFARAEMARFTAGLIIESENFQLETVLIKTKVLAGWR